MRFWNTVGPISDMRKVSPTAETTPSVRIFASGLPSSFGVAAHPPREEIATMARMRVTALMDSLGGSGLRLVSLGIDQLAERPAEMRERRVGDDAVHLEVRIG